MISNQGGEYLGSNWEVIVCISKFFGYSTFKFKIVIFVIEM